MAPAPSMPLTYEFLNDRAESLRRHAAQVRPARDRLEVLRVLVRQCLSLPEDCQDMVAEVRHQAFDQLSALQPGTTFDPAPLLENRRFAERTLDTLAGVIEVCLGLVQAPAVRANFAAEAESLRGALEKVRRIRQDFGENYPLLNEQEAGEARAEMARGEGRELDDAFAAVAGCSKEEWLARVRARAQ